MHRRTGSLLRSGVWLAVATGLAVSGAAAQTASAPVNAASFANPGTSNGAIAQGSMFEIFGSGIADPGVTIANEFPLDKALGGASVSVTVGETTVECPIVRTLNGDRVTAILPSDTPLGIGTMTVEYNGVSSAPVPIEVVAHSPGIFTLNSGGYGPGVYTEAASFAVNTLIESFQPGSLADVWMTGLGAVPYSDAVQPPLEDLPYDVQVMVGDREAEVVFKGRAGCCAGVDIVRIRVPQGVEGCYLPLQVLVEGAPSNVSTISVAAAGGACSDGNFGLYDSEVLSTARETRFSAIGSIYVQTVRHSFGPEEFWLDFVFASFARYNFESLIYGGGFLQASTVGSCLYLPPTQFGIVQPDPETAEVQSLAAGELTLIGPTGSHQIPGALGQYVLFSNPPQPQLLVPGEYQISGSGGRSVGPFTASVTIAPPSVNNLDAISVIDRSQPLTIEYEPLPSAGFLVISGGPSGGSGEGAPQFGCLADPEAGSFTIPSRVLSLFPAGPGGLIVVAGGMKSFDAEGLDRGIIHYVSGAQGSVVQFQ